jgi:hypothetical protein
VSVNRQSYRLPKPLDAAVNVSLEDWKKNGKVKRLWQHDASLWTGTDEGTFSQSVAGAHCACISGKM